MLTNDLTIDEYQWFLEDLARDQKRNKHPVENLTKTQQRLTDPHQQSSPGLSGQNYSRIYHTLVLGYELAGDVPLQVAQTDDQQAQAKASSPKGRSLVKTTESERVFGDDDTNSCFDNVKPQQGPKSTQICLKGISLLDIVGPLTSGGSKPERGIRDWADIKLHHPYPHWPSASQAAPEAAPTWPTYPAGAQSLQENSEPLQESAITTTHRKAQDASTSTWNFDEDKYLDLSAIPMPQVPDISWTWEAEASGDGGIPEASGAVAESTCSWDAHQVPGATSSSDMEWDVIPDPSKLHEHQYYQSPPNGMLSSPSMNPYHPNPQYHENLHESSVENMGGWLEPNDESPADSSLWYKSDIPFQPPTASSTSQTALSEGDCALMNQFTGASSSTGFDLWSRLQFTEEGLEHELNMLPERLQGGPWPEGR